MSQVVSKSLTILFSLSFLSLSFLGSLDAKPEDQKEKKTEKAKPIFKDGEAQVVEAFKDPKKWIQHDLWVETEFDSDGDGKRDRMHVDVTRPGQTDSEGLKVAVIYETSPYYSGVGTNDRSYFWDPKQEVGAEPPKRKIFPPIKHQERRKLISKSHINTWVPLGFAVVHSSSPGTGLSQGCVTIGGKNESLAPKAIVDWLNGRAKGFTKPNGGEEVKATWSTGKVGMTGTSFNGTLPLACATTGVEGLEAIIPIAPNTSYYHYYRSYGLVRHPGGWLGEDIDVLYDFVISGPPAFRDHCSSTVRDKEMMEGFDRKNGDYNDFWAGRDYLNQLKPMKAALLMAHAFNDWNVMPEHSVRIYEAIKAKGVPCQIYFHQGGHGGPPPHKMMNRWFSRYLYGIKNGVEKDPRSWIVREGDKRTEPTPYPEYPHPNAQSVTLKMIGGGQAPGALLLKNYKNQGVESLVDDVAHSGSNLAQAPRSDHRLLFTTGLLKEPLHISGTPKIKIKLACNKPAANLSVWMVSLPWKKSKRVYDNIITRGWADPQNYKSIRKGEPLVPGKFYTMTFDLQPDDQIIPKGQEIGLMIFSSDRDFTLWPKPGTELKVDLDVTELHLPVVGGKQAIEKSLPVRKLNAF